MKRLLAISACFFVLAACGSPSSDPGIPAGKCASSRCLPNPVGPHGYAFESEDAQGKYCTTGIQNFETHREMCLHIQDSKLNQNCALDQRISKFMHDCEPEGYSFFESVACRISLLDKGAVFTGFGEVDPKYIVKAVDYCAGRTVKGPDLAGVHDAGYFHNDIGITVDIEFVPKKETTKDHFSYFKTQLFRGTGDGHFTPMSDVISYDASGAKVVFGELKDHSYKYVVGCGMTWGCSSATKVSNQ